MIRLRIAALIYLLFISFAINAGERIISKAELTDRVLGFWNGQLLGNYIGFPFENLYSCLLYTSPSPRDLSTSRMPSSA